MTNELNVLNRLREVIIRDLDTEGLDPVGETNVLIDFPDQDSMPARSAIYIQPNYCSYDTLTVESDQVELTVSIFVVCKRDTRANLTIKTMAYVNKLYKLLSNDQELDGEIDYLRPETMDFYPALGENKDVKGAEISITLVFSKDFED